jgi:hypothetical protein
MSEAATETTSEMSKTYHQSPAGIHRLDTNENFMSLSPRKRMRLPVSLIFSFLFSHLPECVVIPGP